MDALIVLVLVAVGCLIVVRGFALLVARLSAAAVPAIAGGRQLPKSFPNPSPYAKRNLFSAAERSFYEVLCRLAPEYTIFAKVRLADLVRVEASGREFWQRFNSITGKHVDFVLCDGQLAPVVAIELDDLSHEEGDRVARDKFVDAVLLSAELPVLRVKAKHGYMLDEIRQLLTPHLQTSGSSLADSPHAEQATASRRL
jgi:very-short-patch-repair endonuclease